MEHIKYQSTKTLVENNIPVLLFGPAGTGKTTIAMHIAKDLDLPFYSLSMTKQTTVNAIFQRDYPLVMATTFMSACMVILGNLVADILYSALDPRIRYD